MWRLRKTSRPLVQNWSEFEYNRETLHHADLKAPPHWRTITSNEAWLVRSANHSLLERIILMSTGPAKHNNLALNWSVKDVFPPAMPCNQRQDLAGGHERANVPRVVVSSDATARLNSDEPAITADGRALSASAVLVSCFGGFSFFCQVLQYCTVSKHANGSDCWFQASGLSLVRRRSEQFVSGPPELPSEGILRSYAASQHLQIERQQSLSHYSVLPFLRTVSLEQALLTHVPYIPTKERQTTSYMTGSAAAAA